MLRGCLCASLHRRYGKRSRGDGGQRRRRPRQGNRQWRRRRSRRRGGRRVPGWRRRRPGRRLALQPRLQLRRDQGSGWWAAGVCCWRWRRWGQRAGTGMLGTSWLRGEGGRLRCLRRQGAGNGGGVAGCEVGARCNAVGLYVGGRMALLGWDGWRQLLLPSPARDVVTVASTSPSVNRRPDGSQACLPFTRCTRKHHVALSAWRARSMVGTGRRVAAQVGLVC